MNCEEVNEEYHRVLEWAREHCNDPPEVEVALVPMLLYSDSTHLTSFGSASLWPIYAFFGFVSKYVRAKPTSFSAHHIAYLPDGFQDWYEREHGDPASEETLKFCRREIMQLIWTLLLDPEFRKAYIEGLLWQCGDHILRRLFPRFFIYSADYPEKILLACLRYLAECPCPRCYVRKKDIHLMGTVRDMQQRANHIRIDTDAIQFDIDRTRSWIFEDGYPANSTRITKVLGARSLLPLRSAFSKFSSSLPQPLHFNHYHMLVVDIMHEFELGVWKAVLIHLLRILYLLKQLARFNQSTNVSDLKQMSARAYEDVLRVLIDAMLPPPHDDIVMDLLFALAEWHAFAKLRLHTERTLALFEESVKTLGKAMRRFQSVTCPAFQTKELPREVAARGRRQAAATARTRGKGKAKASASTTARRVAVGGPRPKGFNLNTYKFHSLGDAPTAVRQMQSQSTSSDQPATAQQFPTRRTGNRRHRLVSTGQNRRSQGENSEGLRPLISSERRGGVLPFTADEHLGPTPPDARYHVADSQRHWEDIPSWIAKHRNDPATRNFLPRLKDHLLGRMLRRPFETDEQQFTPVDHRRVLIDKDRMYLHKVLRVNYTTYDMRRSQDSINPRTHPNIMLLAHEDEDEDNQDKHTYWYARVLSIFHVHVRLLAGNNTSTQRDVVHKLDVLWVRWYGLDFTAPGGFKHRRLHRLGFVPDDDPDAFGFLDPEVVLRASHIMPAFAYGKVDDLLPPSRCARSEDEEDLDYQYYYIGM
ncbi:hypothetical protein DAEQUDRAFT_780622 [Daedalea quercina L-15889]|uniref:Uncharacterized protein n=1 Tax=Daedalea quercina L-15889 TaxID=1314783 RepID=A0A165KKJ3_9APHY|nr:hypothetical protein DAEQUDRAFT_780622 [Daedalea quercina L-15889]